MYYYIILYYIILYYIILYYIILYYIILYIRKVKWSRYRPGVAQKVGRSIALLFMIAALEGGEWSAARPGRTLPAGKNRYTFYKRLRGPQGRSGQAKVSSQPGFDPGPSSP